MDKLSTTDDTSRKQALEIRLFPKTDPKNTNLCDLSQNTVEKIRNSYCNQ